MSDARLPLSKLLQAAGRAFASMRAEGLGLQGALAAAGAKLPPSERGALQAILYDAVRRRALAEAALEALTEHPPKEPVRSILTVALALVFSGTYKDFTLADQTVRALRADPKTARAAGFATAVLRRAMRERSELAAKLEARDDVRYNVPAWWLARVQAAWPEYWREVLEPARSRPPMTLRINRRRTDMETYRAKLDEAGMAHRVLGPEALMLEAPVPVESVPGFAEGLVSVQDAGVQLAAHFLPVKPGDRVLDACAAPGGKTAHLLELVDCRMTALEIDPDRARRIEETLSRLGLKAEILTADAAATDLWWDKEPFDAVLLDAPCTASGIVRRQPDVPWNRRPVDIRALAREQARLLKALWPLVKKGGHLLFVTCSIFPEEGPEQVSRFLAETPDAENVPLAPGLDGMMRLIPLARDTSPDGIEPAVHDGFFYALFRKA